MTALHAHDGDVSLAAHENGATGVTEALRHLVVATIAHGWPDDTAFDAALHGAFAALGEAVPPHHHPSPAACATPLEAVEMPISLRYILQRWNIETVEALLALRPFELRNIRGLGAKRYRLLRNHLAAQGYITPQRPAGFGVNADGTWQEW